MRRDSIERWKKRRIEALAGLDPSQVDFDALDELVVRLAAPSRRSTSRSKGPHTRGKPSI
ncbi:MAG: hypothetical protein GY910_23735 [bacterium]|nr:hypothetical protein [Deltaproteobacteria bacterium]MCP4907995.1 hypothetical protein [bacterium]